MADSILRLRVDSAEYNNKLKQASEQLTRYADGCRKAGGTLQYVDDGIVEFARSLGKMETSATSARGQLAEMTKAFTEWSVRYNKMTDEEKKGEFGKALSQSLDQLKVRIQDSKTELDDINKSINGGGGLSGALDSFADKLGLNITQLTKFGSVAGVATTALKVAKDAFFQSESNIDEWGRTVKGAEGAYNVFLDTLNNGNWSNFFDNLSKAIQGGRDLYDVFDRLGSIKSNNAAAIAIVQQQIAQLRLAKQQGENVDAQLKAATARLAELQKQSINAGKAAGTKSAFEVIRSGVNTVGGARINDATINYAIDRIMKNGQSEFDKYRYNRDLLQKRGTRTVVTSVDDGYGGTVNKYQNVFDINLLTKEQQKQYALAQAITEGETRIQKGIAAYAQAVQEGTSSAREEFKGNRYALQGSGGGGSKGGSGKTTTAPTYAEDSIAAQQAAVSELRKKWSEAGEAVRNDLLVQLIAAEDKLKSMNNQAALFRENQKGKLLGNTPDGQGIQTSGLGSITIAEQINEASKGLQGNALESLQKLIKGGKDTQKSWENAASAIGSVGSALAGINNPAAKIMGIVAEAVANIALGFAMATAKDSKLGVFGWIAAIAGGLGTMISTISAIHSATGFAEGGVVGGSTFSGDQIPAMLNAGEVVLNRAQTGNLASQLQENGGGGAGRVVGVLRGEDIALVADRWGRRTGRGELAFFK